MSNFENLKNSYNQLVNNLSSSNSFDAHKILHEFHNINENDLYLDSFYFDEINALMQDFYALENIDFENYEKWLIDGN